VLAAVVAGLALIASCVAGLLIAAAINPGFDPHLYYLKGAAPAMVVAMAITFGCARLLRAGNLVAGIAAVAVPALVTALVFAEGFASQPDKEADLARSRAFLETFEHPAGLKLIRTETIESYRDGDIGQVGFLNPYKGYYLVETWLLPRGTTRDSALAFYRDELERHGWTVQDQPWDCTGISDPNQCEVDLLAYSGGEYVTGIAVVGRPDDRITASL
jgi:hypothetical protein